MARIQEPLEDHDNRIDYDEIKSRFPWIIQRNQKCILSPDSDGFLCGLLLSQFLDWEIVGFYDEKILLVKEDIRPVDCIFIDVDINRSCVKSVGHHIVSFNKKLSPPNFNYTSCIQPNIMRNFDGRNDFQSKYPFGTIHLLLSILQSAKIIRTIPENSIWPLLFTDGVWNNLFGYTENCLDWINYLGIDQDEHILNPMFCNNNYSFYDIMLGLNRFLRMRDGFNAKGYYFDGQYKLGGHNKRTGDSLRISNSKNVPINLETINSAIKIHNNEKSRIEGFIISMCAFLKWEYHHNKWHWENLKLFKFTKEDFDEKDSSGKKLRKLNNGTYMEMMGRNPFSLAMTSGDNIEYTIEQPDTMT